MSRLAEVLDEARNLGVPIETFINRISEHMPLGAINILGIETRAAIIQKEEEA